MIVRSPWNRKLLPRREEDRLLCKSDQDACGEHAPAFFQTCLTFTLSKNEHLPRGEIKPENK